MTILYPAPARIKSNAFGRGVLRSLPNHKVSYTQTDAAWWAAESARQENARLDVLAGERASEERYERGLCC